MAVPRRSGLTAAEWALLQPLLPPARGPRPAAPGGHTTITGGSSGGLRGTAARYPRAAGAPVAAVVPICYPPLLPGTGAVATLEHRQILRTGLTTPETSLRERAGERRRLAEGGLKVHGKEAAMKTYRDSRLIRACFGPVMLVGILALGVRPGASQSSDATQARDTTRMTLISRLPRWTKESRAES